jgi:predicted  nucleic acid-binding Zn-ribbon protein
VKKTQLATHQKELQLKEREGRIEDVRTRLNSASTNKEYQAWIEQIAADEQANSVLSDEILELFDKVEQVQGGVAETAADLAKATEEFGKLKQRIEGEKGSMESDVARLTSECSELEKTLPSDIKQDFDRIVGTRGEDGLACVEGEFCGHCNQMINPQMFNEMLMEKMVLCKSCGAILYLPEDREPKRRDD